MNRKLIVVIAIIVIFILIFANVYLEVKAIRSIKIEIHDVKVKQIAPSILLDIKVRVYNQEARKIDDLKGDFEIYILNVSTGEIEFGEVDIPPHSYKNVSMPLVLRYRDIAEGVVEAIKKMDFNVSIKGSVEGRVFFGLLKYEEPVEAKWSIE